MGIPFDITFHPSWWHANTGVSFNRIFFEDPEYRIAADLKMRRLLYDKFGDFGLGEREPQPRPILGSDLIASGYLHSEIMGCEVRYSDENPPEVLCADISDEKLKSIQAPDLDKSESWQRIANQIEFLQKEFGHVNSCINLMGIQNIAMDLRGQKLFMDYYLNSEAVHNLLEACTKVSIEIGTRLKSVSKEMSAGVTAIVKQIASDVYVTSNCTVEMISLETYKSFLLKYDNILADIFKPFGIHHCGQTMEHVVGGYAQIKNMTFAEVGAYSDLEYVREKLPNIHLNARYSPVKLAKVEVSELREDISKLVGKGKPSELLSVSCVGIDKLVSDDQVRNFLKCCKDIKL
ncbi:uroporphyrinogen decarboxylase family protein [Desulfitibacter alkalitolerans]|uniref:uroporphyrinogen decarboxylase family protein n=1 Tax=Desulfitibacter alkalitolerans TaxID=264641 RepID=UPI000486407E|nr:uroporphyrinogen decarboxylase family protein [Desulfitibacter alkalitolerans]